MKARTLMAVGLAGIAAQEWIARRYYRRHPGPERFVHEQEGTAWTAPWHETWAPAEWLLLRAAPIYRGVGVPRGDGAPVLLVAGLMLRGRYLETLRAWLERVGYRARIADIGRAADCFDVLTGRLLEAIERTGAAPVHLVGHSMGGLLARAAAARASGRVASVTTLGTPLRGLQMHPAVRATAAAVRAVTHARRGAAVHPRCITLACECPAVRALRTPLTPRQRQLAIVTRHDGVTDWRYCLAVESMDVLEVGGSHTGLVWNPRAYRAIAAHLASARIARTMGTPA